MEEKRMLSNIAGNHYHAVNDAHKLLLCAPEEFPYSETELQKLIEREQTIRTQWQLDLADDWNSAMQKTKGTHDGGHGSKISEQKPCRYLAVEYLPHAIEGIIALLNKLEAKTATKDKQNIQLLSRLPWLEFTAIAFTNMIDSAIKRDNVATVIERIAGACEVEARWRHYATYAESLYDRILKQQRQSGMNVEFITKVLTVAMDRLARGEYGDSGKHPEVEWANWPKGKDSFSRWLSFSPRPTPPGLRAAPTRASPLPTSPASRSSSICRAMPKHRNRRATAASSAPSGSGSPPGWPSASIRRLPSSRFPSCFSRRFRPGGFRCPSC